MSDLVALFLIVSLLTGFASHRLKKRLQTTNHRDTARVLTPPHPNDSQWEHAASAPVTAPAESQPSRRTGVPAH